MPGRSRALAGALALVIACTCGCTTVFKDDYWTEIHRQSDEDALARLRGDPTITFFLGVRAPAFEQPFQVGIPVLHVYAESPAAKAGLRTGDEIRAIGGRSVRTPGDARWVLSLIGKDEEASERIRRLALAAKEDALPDDFVPHAKTKLVYARDGREISVELELVSREGYQDLRRRRVLDTSRYEESGSNGWGFRKRRTVPPEFVNQYFGVLVPREIKIAQEWDILPIALGFSIFRHEKVYVADARRLTLLCSLLQFSSRGDDVSGSLEGLIPAPPVGTTDV